MEYARKRAQDLAVSRTAGPEVVPEYTPTPRSSPKLGHKPTARESFFQSVEDQLTQQLRIYSLEESLQEVPERWQDPVIFAQEVLGHQTWDLQEQMLRKMMKPQARVAVKGCHNSSKTHAACELVIWWLVVQRGIVLTTAPVWAQVAGVIWDRIRDFAMKAGLCDGKFGFRLPKPNLTDWYLAPGNYAKGMSTDKMERFQGWKGRVLLIIDEAPGVRPDLFGTIKTFAGGDSRVLMTGNPNLVGGPFFEAFTSERSEWDTLTISAFDSPNLRGLIPPGKVVEEVSDEELFSILRSMDEDAVSYSPWPMLATRRYVLNMVGDMDWDWRVMGRFPRKQQDSLIPLDWIEKCAKLKLVVLEEDEDPNIIAGVDVASGGENETVVTIRRGPDLLELVPLRHDDARGPTVQVLKPYKDRLQSVRVDADGQGEYFARHLEDLGYPVIRIHSGAAPMGTTDSEREKAKDDFANLKAQMWVSVRDKFEEGRVRGLTDRIAIAQLSTVRSKTTPRGQIAVEKKEELTRRGVSSPDRADSIIYCYFDFPSHGRLRIWS